ncbi:MAG TPA: tetratricopeptide repeat protein, partial [Longimicrobiaceae bacterium]|nr:tetratricopeptide repeat protein [Longimicrobiaceae bacterium]
MNVKAALVVLAAVFITCEGGAESGAPGPDPALATPIDSLLAAAEDRYWSGDIAGARVSFQAALARSRRIADGPGEARALTWLGLAAYRLGDHPEARLRGEEALTLKLRLGLDEELAKSYSALGLLAFAEGRYFDAVELQGQAIEIAEVVADTVAVTKARTNLGLAYTELGDFHRARQLFLGALQGARVLDDPLIEGRVLTNLGMLAVRTGDPAAAIRYLRAARGPLRLAQDVVGEQNAIGQLGTAWGAIGEPGRAIATLDTALQMSRDQGLRQEESSNLEALAELHREAGDLRRGLALFREARAINEVLGLEDETGADLRSEAEIHAALGNLDLALRAGRAALEIHRRVGSRFAEVNDLLLLADLSRDAGRPGEAEDFLRQARATAIDLDAPSARATVALAEARSAEARDLPRRVLAILRENDPVLPAAGADAAWESHALTARAFARIGQADSAVAAGWRAVAAVERLRGGYASGSLRTSFTATRGAVYLRLVEDLIRLGRIEEAFEIADRSHGRALLEHVSTLRSDGGATVRELAEEERQLLERIDELTAWSREARAEGTDEPALDEERERLAAELERTREAYAAALIRA